MRFHRQTPRNRLACPCDGFLIDNEELDGHPDLMLDLPANKLGYSDLFRISLSDTNDKIVKCVPIGDETIVGKRL